MARNKTTTNTQTTAQRLRSVIKSARDIMRKDKGLSGDLDSTAGPDLDDVSQISG